MNNQIKILKTIKYLLNNDDIINDHESSTLICWMLKPFTNKPTQPIKEVVVKLLQKQHICTRCYEGKLNYSSDLYCKSCKSALKNNSRKKIK